MEFRCPTPPHHPITSPSPYPLHRCDFSRSYPTQEADNTLVTPPESFASTILALFKEHEMKRSAAETQTQKVKILSLDLVQPSFALDKIDTPELSDILNYIVSTPMLSWSNSRALTTNVSAVVKNKCNRSRTHALQRQLRTGTQGARNDNWSTLMEEITPSLTYWKLTKALKSEGYEPTPALKKPDNTVAFDDRYKAECLANSIDQQWSHTSPHTTHNT
ncbi:hypothetical protein EVAR_31030_1 [Eumeta japonica]|uniref:Uncharacterized protein n=1 Tax=Eumeta variegata TaxID=151549 RepID=A0A4C1VFF9_EUMVA|nr:hypothetical protein EVAR_31030_1 [Eumeta japonica]